MRHFYVRLVIGLVWVVAAILSATAANIPLAMLYVVLGIVFLSSAYFLWKKEKSNRR